MLKRCSHCREEKPINQFTLNKREKDGHDRRCRDCKKESAYKYRNSEKGKIARRHAGRSRPKDKVKIYNKKVKEKERFSFNRDYILQRDSGCCVICGSDYRIQVHHIDETGRGKNKGEHNNEPSNLVTLCCVCHGKVHFSPNFENEKQYLKDYMIKISAVCTV